MLGLPHAATRVHYLRWWRRSCIDSLPAQRLGMLMVVAENDRDAKRFVAALENQLDAEGCITGVI
jgi:hypothetical protein